MPQQYVDKQRVETQQSMRAFIQEGGAVFGNPAKFAGIDSSYLIVGDVTVPRGDVTNIPLYDPYGLRQYTSGGTQETAPDLATGTLTFLHNWGGLPAQFLAGRCGLDVYVLRGDCTQLGDPNKGWKDFVMILPNGRVTSQTFPGMAWSDDNVSEYNHEVTWRGVPYPYAQTTISEIGATTVQSPVVESLFWNARDCGQCGPINTGVEWIYAVKRDKTTSPAASPAIEYSLDGGDTVAQLAITGIGATETVIALRQIGDKLTVFTRNTDDSGAHYYATIGLTGVPSAFTKVSGGYDTDGPINDVLVLSETSIFIVGDSGYIYHTDDITRAPDVVSAGTITSNNLMRIASDGDQIIYIGGANGVILKSVDRGNSFALGVAPVAETISALALDNEFYLWAFTEDGTAWVSFTGAESWVEATSQFPGVTAFTDARRVTRNVWMVAYVASTVARLSTSYMGGARWSASHIPNSRVRGFGTYASINRIAVPTTGIPDIDANHYMLAGDSASAGDGVWLRGLPVLK